MNCVLVLLLIYILSNNITTSFIVALLFGIHPLHVESVAWISGRKDVLYALFFLASLSSYACFLREQKKIYYYLSLLLYIVSLLSKSMAVSLPLVLILLDYLLNRKISWGLLKNKIPFFTLSLIFGILALLSQQDAIRHDYSGDSLVKNLIIASHGLVFYLEKMLLPVQLSSLYQYSIKDFEIMKITFLLSPFIVAVLTTLAVYSVRYTKKVVFGGMFYFVTLLPVLQLIPVGHAFAADRYTYISLIGIFYILGEGFSWLFEKQWKYSRLPNIIVFAIAGLVFCTLGFLTWNLTHIWKDGVTLWSNVLKNYPLSSIAYNNRGAAYFINKKYNETINDLTMALSISPNYDQANANLCRTYIVTGFEDKALPFCLKAVQINPRMDDIYNLLGNLYYKKDMNVAIFLYKKSIEVKPINERAYYNLCTTYLSMHEYENAAKACQKAIEIDPEFADAHSNLGNVYLATGKQREALVSYKKALEINPELASAHNNLGVAYYYYTKQYDLSVKHINRAIELGYKVNPEFLELLRPYQERNQ
jgi:Tfp pilus assembly protein PilF